MNTPSTGQVLVGCGILRSEVEFLIAKNGWSVETHFLCSALHNYFDKLYSSLDSALTSEEKRGKSTAVFYGACHPLMDRLITAHETVRIREQNCITMLLGEEIFMKELSGGTYFLLEEWAQCWEPMLTACFGKRRDVIREIFHGSHSSMTAVRTPVSGDFSQSAEAAAQFVDLPLKWLDTDLSHLEKVLSELLAQKIRGDSDE